MPTTPAEAVDLKLEVVVLAFLISIDRLASLSHENKFSKTKRSDDNG